MTIQAVIVMSASISALLTILSNDWKIYLLGILISWAVIITDILTNKQR